MYSTVYSTVYSAEYSTVYSTVNSTEYSTVYSTLHILARGILNPYRSTTTASIGKGKDRPRG